MAAVVSGGAYIEAAALSGRLDGTTGACWPLLGSRGVGTHAALDLPTACTDAGMRRVGVGPGSDDHRLRVTDRMRDCASVHNCFYLMFK